MAETENPALKPQKNAPRLLRAHFAFIVGFRAKSLLREFYSPVAVWVNRWNIGTVFLVNYPNELVGYNGVAARRKVNTV